MYLDRNKFSTTTTTTKFEVIERTMNEKLFESTCFIILRKWSSQLFSPYFAHAENLTMDEEQGERKKLQTFKIINEFF